MLVEGTINQAFEKGKENEGYSCRIHEGIRIDFVARHALSLC